VKEAIGANLGRYLIETLNSPSYDDFMQPLEEFIVLQRFIRTALGGGLGNDFPLAKLIQLERETRKYVPFQPTIRWEPAKSDAGSLQDFLKTLKDADPKAAEAYEAWRKDSQERRTQKRPVCASVSK
jgi:hypothetical protein